MEGGQKASGEAVDETVFLRQKDPSRWIAVRYLSHFVSPVCAMTQGLNKNKVKYEIAYPEIFVALPGEKLGIFAGKRLYYFSIKGL